MPPRTYRVTVTLYGTDRQIVGPPSTISQAGSDFDKISAAQGHGGPVERVAWLSVHGRGVKETSLSAAPEPVDESRHPWPRVARITDRWADVAEERGHDRAKAAIWAAPGRVTFDVNDGCDIVYALRYSDRVDLPQGATGARLEASINVWQDTAGLCEEGQPAIIFEPG
ncbi:MAG: hypothetical protein ACRDQZ_01845 [Mycobacteriales bacterium]